MSRRFLEFDPGNFRFGRFRLNIGKILARCASYFVVTLTLTVLVYLLFTLLFRTDVEKKLQREIRMYESIYSSLQQKEELLKDAITHLQYEDNEIYEEIFHSNAPAADPMSGLEYMFASDTIPDTKLTSYTRDKSDRLLEQAARVEESFSKIFRALKDTALVLPPMSMPVSDISYSQVGASTGRKMDPFYQAYVFHEGLDLILNRGSDVYAAADGVVVAVTNSKHFGRMVEIEHAGGYTTAYAHLESASVRKGALVKRGQKIGAVGMTGKAFAPHLHYEVRKDGVSLDPVNYFFASVDPDEYANMLFMAVNTMQSMD